MVVDCNYGQLYVIEGAPPPGGEDIPEDAVRRALTWLIDNCEEEAGTLKVNFLNLSIVDFSSLATASPELAPLKKNMHGFRMLLEFVQNRFRDGGNTTLSMPSLQLSLMTLSTARLFFLLPIMMGIHAVIWLSPMHTLCSV